MAFYSNRNHPPTKLKFKFFYVACGATEVKKNKQSFGSGNGDLADAVILQEMQ